MFSFNPIEWLALQRLSFAKPKQILQRINDGHFSKRELNLAEAKKDFETVQRLGLEIITWGSKNYPEILKEIYDPPLVLLAKGKWDLWQKREWVAVVGARKATEFSRNKIKEFVPQFVAQGFGIVSGLAYGVDAEAHRACVEAGGVTWGVLGSGVDLVYPSTHQSLAEKMTKQGGILSEFPLGSRPFPSYFPQRNRIISGLVQTVVIVQATFKSGSLITARFALEQGRDVFVVVPPDDSVAYEGNKKLLDEGAIPLGDPADCHCEEGKDWLCQSVQQSRQTLRSQIATKQSPSDSALIALLQEPQSVESLVLKTQKAPGELLSELIQLEMEGLVKKIPGSLWQSL